MGISETRDAGDAVIDAGLDARFDELFPELFRAAYRVAFRLLGSREEAADCARYFRSDVNLRRSAAQFLIKAA